MSNIIDRWKKVVEENEQIKRSIKDLKQVSTRNKERIDQNFEMMDESIVDIKNMEHKIVERMARQEEVLRYIAELGETQNQDDDRLRQMVEIMQQEQKELNRIFRGIEDVRSHLLNFENQLMEEIEKKRLKEFSVMKSYFKAVLWLLLIFLCLFGAYIWGFIGNSGL